MAVTRDGTQYTFGGAVIDIDGNNYLLQDFSVSEGTNVIELEGSDGSVISQVFVGRPKELSGTAVVDASNPNLTQGQEFALEGVNYLVTETSVSRSNGSFATQSFSAREKLND
jgi:hypothetical protein